MKPKERVTEEDVQHVIDHLSGHGDSDNTYPSWTCWFERWHLERCSGCGGFLFVCVDMGAWVVGDRIQVRIGLYGLVAGG
jgi:hypothetical protein